MKTAFQWTQDYKWTPGGDGVKFSFRQIVELVLAVQRDALEEAAKIAEAAMCDEAHTNELGTNLTCVSSEAIRARKKLTLYAYPPTPRPDVKEGEGV